VTARVRLFSKLFAISFDPKGAQLPASVPSRLLASLAVGGAENLPASSTAATVPAATTPTTTTTPTTAPQSTNLLDLL
jgi:hypothetical protein